MYSRSIDEIFTIFLNNNFRNPLFDFLSMLIDNFFFMPIFFFSALYLIKKKSDDKILFLSSLISGCIVFISSLLMKYVINRERPYEYLKEIIFLVAQEDPSFPSLHSAVSFAVAYSVYRCNKKAGILFFALSLFISYSRVYAGVHFVSDVIFGALIGVLSVNLIISKKEKILSWTRKLNLK